MKASRAGIFGVLAATALVLPAGANAAAAKPSVSTGTAANVAPTSATLIGMVRPNEASTTYNFQYGESTKYTASTPRASAGDSDSLITVAQDIGSLKPDTTYHYRIVARNSKGTVPGADRTFKTRPQPLGFTLAVTPNPVEWDGNIVVGGVLAGTGTAGKQVVLQANPFPFVQGFRRIGNPQVVNSSGAFAFPIFNLQTNTQYRVGIPDTPTVSEPVTAAAALKVSIKLQNKRVKRGNRLRFAGTVRPLRNDLNVGIQKQNSKGNWVTVSGTKTNRGSDSFSKWAKRVKIRRGGQYRAFVQITDGSLVSAATPPIKVSSYTKKR